MFNEKIERDKELITVSEESRYALNRILDDLENYTDKNLDYLEGRAKIVNDWLASLKNLVKTIDTLSAKYLKEDSQEKISNEKDEIEKLAREALKKAGLEGKKAKKKN